MALKKFISNEGWKMPNMKETLQRIVSLQRNIFGVALLRSLQLDKKILSDASRREMLAFDGIHIVHGNLRLEKGSHGISTISQLFLEINECSYPEWSTLQKMRGLHQ